MIPQTALERPNATGRHHVHVAREGWRGLRRHPGRLSAPLAGVLSAVCQIARSLGGPCGCFASEYFFGHSVRELWLANAWLSFPHVAAAAGTAAVWPGRHVAPVVANNNDGTVMVRDSWAVHRVGIAGLVFVDPRGGHRPIGARRRYGSA